MHLRRRRVNPENTFNCIKKSSSDLYKNFGDRSNSILKSVLKTLDRIEADIFKIGQSILYFLNCRLNCRNFKESVNPSLNSFGRSDNTVSQKLETFIYELVIKNKIMQSDSRIAKHCGKIKKPVIELAKELINYSKSKFKAAT